MHGELPLPCSNPAPPAGAGLPWLQVLLPPPALGAIAHPRTPCPQRTAAGQGLRRLCRAPERAPRWEPQPEASEGQHWHYTQWLRRLGCHGAAPEPEEAASPSPSPVPVPHPVRSPPHCTLDSIAHPGSGVARGLPRPAREGMAW